MNKAYAELKSLRLEMKFSIGEMAAIMCVSKATYQGYETGRRPLPAGFVNRVDAQLAVEGFEFGIPSEIKREDLKL